MSIFLYNSLTRQKEEFQPLDPSRVTMYLCGPTVYNYAHIGNARPGVIFGVLRQLLARQFPHVVFARNITDVEDKINARAEEEGVSIDVITDRYTKAYHEDLGGLNVAMPDIEPYATEHIDGIIAMINRLIDGGHAYVAEGHALFAVESFDNYGALSGRDMKEMIAGARVEVAPYKRHPGDFVLWKPSTGTQPGWDSPWGFGRPGWHIECSVMAERHLGPTIDIHAGGQDLIFPHHENEVAQSTCAHDGAPFARFWLHNGFVTFEQRKMSKSLGNTLIIRELLKQHPGEVLRYMLLGAHYRQPLDWSDSAVDQAHRTLDRLYAVLRDQNDRFGPFSSTSEPEQTVIAALEDDINTPNALAALNQLARKLAKADDAQSAQSSATELLASARFLGLLMESPEDWFARGTDELDHAAIDQLIAERDQARAEKNFGRADEIRDQLDAIGVVLEDGTKGSRWKLKRSE